MKPQTRTRRSAGVLVGQRAADAWTVRNSSTDNITPASLCTDDSWYLSDMYPFHPNIRKVLSRANNSVTGKRMWQRLPSSADNLWQVPGSYSCLFKQRHGDSSPPLSRKTELRGSRQVTVSRNKSRDENWGACQLKRQSGRWENTGEQREVWWLRQEIYLAALKNRLQTRNCWEGWNCSPPHPTPGCTDGRHTTRTGWTCRKRNNGQVCVFGGLLSYFLALSQRGLAVQPPLAWCSSRVYGYRPSGCGRPFSICRANRASLLALRWLKLPQVGTF